MFTICIVGTFFVFGGLIASEVARAAKRNHNHRCKP